MPASAVSECGEADGTAAAAVAAPSRSDALMTMGMILLLLRVHDDGGGRRPCLSMERR
ncbi:hypothetical protein ACHAXA_008736 [Cyclostephanos tholiformis]|uniref:Uncharacterized protein n=1 Tax=Cyclostephanos tholiformis TaxID=382380 RepID=A0ABD3RFB1_9STRA